MSHHLIDISAPSCVITCRHGQLICRPDNGPERAVPMEDVGAVLINSFSATVHSRVFLEAVRCGTIIIFCEDFKPSSLVLPANRFTDTALTRAQLGLSPAARKALWMKTVTAKCLNQAAVAERFAPDLPQTRRLRQAAGSPRPDKESTCARLYWAAVSAHLGLRRFKRDRQRPGVNGLLNYGYAVLLARILQRLVAVGVDPVCGISHVVRERATPLAYDLMEPFRVAVDTRVAAWVRERQRELTDPRDRADETVFPVTPEFKRMVQGFTGVPAPYKRKELTLDHVIVQALQGFREAVLHRRPGAYTPWTLKDSRWDGSL